MQRRCAVDRDALPQSDVRLAPESDGQQLTLFASVPLTEEDRVPLEESELIVAQGGQLVTSKVSRYRSTCAARAEGLRLGYGHADQRVACRSKLWLTAAVTLAGFELAHRIRKRQFNFRHRSRRFGVNRKMDWEIALA